MVELKQESLGYLGQIPVSPEAVLMAERLIKTGVSCQVVEERISQANRLLGFQKAFPRVGLCVMSWSLTNGIESIGRGEILKALASDDHHLMTKEGIKLYAIKYGLKSLKDINGFYVFDLVMGGKLGIEGKRGVLYYPSKEKTLTVFELKPGEVDEKRDGSWGLVHLGQVVFSIEDGASVKEVKGLVEEVRQVHQSQPVVGKLIGDLEGERVRFFTPVASEPHR